MSEPFTPAMVGIIDSVMEGLMGKAPSEVSEPVYQARAVAHRAESVGVAPRPVL